MFRTHSAKYRICRDTTLYRFSGVVLVIILVGIKVLRQEFKAAILDFGTQISHGVYNIDHDLLCIWT